MIIIGGGGGCLGTILVLILLGVLVRDAWRDHACDTQCVDGGARSGSYDTLGAACDCYPDQAQLACAEPLLPWEDCEP